MSAAALGLEVALLALQTFNAMRRHQDPGSGDPVVDTILIRWEGGQLTSEQAGQELIDHVRAKGNRIMDEWRAAGPDSDA